jgi:hypothetical protein
MITDTELYYHIERVVKTLIVFAGVTFIARGYWDISAHYLFPDDTLLSCIASITLGVLIIAFFSPNKVYTLV